MRTNIVNIVIGGRGTGKTTFLQGSLEHKVTGIVDSYLHNNPNQKILIVGHFLHENWDHVEQIDIKDIRRWVRGVRRCVVNLETLREDILKISADAVNTVIIFEDATSYIAGGVLPMWWRRVPADSKQKNQDIYFVFHALMQVPPDLVRLANFVVLFKTGEEFNNTVRNKYPFPTLHEAYHKVQKSSNKYAHESVRIQ